MGLRINTFVRAAYKLETLISIALVSAVSTIAVSTITEVRIEVGRGKVHSSYFCNTT